MAAIASGLSRRQAAVRFGVSAASAVRWQQLANQHGTSAPQQQGGDRRSMRIEAHAGLILDAYKAIPDITLAELQALLVDHGTELDLDSEQLVFIDETWASTNMARRYGRAPCGERLRAGVPHGH